MSGIKFDIKADGSNAMGAIHQVQHASQHLAKEIGGELKSTIVEAFTVAAISEFVTKMVEFADATVKGAEALNVTTDKFQALKIAAREAHVDMAVVEKSFSAIDKAARDALGGDSKALKGFASLGITSESDLKNLDKTSLLQKMMQGTEGMSRSQAVGSLSALNIKGVAANNMLAMQPTLANFDQFTKAEKDSGKISKQEDLENLAEFQDKIEAISDEIKTTMIPVLSWLLETAMNVGRGIKRFVEMVGTVIGAVWGEIDNFDFKGLIKAFGDNLLNGFKSLFDNLWKVITGKLSVKDALGNIAKDDGKATQHLLEGAFGKEGSGVIKSIISDQAKQYTEEDKKREEEEAKKKAERLRRNGEKDGEAGRTATIKKDEKVKEQKSLLEEVKASGLVNVGGLGGVDSAYRATKLSEQANEYLKQLVKNTSKNTEAEAPEDPYDSYGEFSDK